MVVAKQLQLKEVFWPGPRARKALTRMVNVWLDGRRKHLLDSDLTHTFTRLMKRH